MNYILGKGYKPQLGFRVRLYSAVDCVCENYIEMMVQTKWQWQRMI